MLLYYQPVAKCYAAFHASEAVYELMAPKIRRHLPCRVATGHTLLGSVRRLAPKSPPCVSHVRFRSNNPNKAGPPKDFRQEGPKAAHLGQYFMNS